MRSTTPFTLSAASLRQWRLAPLSFPKFLRDYPYWFPPATLALVLTLLYLNPFIGDWDALDYTIYSLRGEPSSMALGPSLFSKIPPRLSVLVSARDISARPHAP